MHRTEGLHNDSGLFTDGPPGTNIEQNWCNAIQEEICYVIEQAGLSLNTAGTETRIQLKDAINIMISGAGGVGSLQALDCNLNSNKSILPTVDGSNNIYIGTTAKTFSQVYTRGVNNYIRADTNVSIAAGASSYLEGDTEVSVYSTTDGSAKGYFGSTSHSFDEIYLNCDNELDIICGDFDLNATGDITIDSGTNMTFTSGGTVTVYTDSTMKLTSVSNGIDDIWLGDATHYFDDAYFYFNGEWVTNVGVWDLNCTTGDIDAASTMLITSGAGTIITSDADDADTLSLGQTGKTWADIEVWSDTIKIEQSTDIIPTNTAYSLEIGTDADDFSLIGIKAAGAVDITSLTTMTLNGTSKVDINSASGLIELDASSHVLINNVLMFVERSTDPTKPSEGTGVMWLSDGTGLGDDGDMVYAGTAGGVTKYGYLVDHSGAPYTWV